MAPVIIVSRKIAATNTILAIIQTLIITIQTITTTPRRERLIGGIETDCRRQQLLLVLS